MLMDVSRALKTQNREMGFEKEVSVEPQEFCGETVELKEPVRIEGVYTGRGGVVNVKGDCRARAVMHCARCLEPVEIPVDVEFDEDFFQDNPDNDPDRLMLVDGKIDLTAVAETAVFMTLPMRVLCRPDCKGLCMVCGANLNQSQCSCNGRVMLDSGDGQPEPEPTHRPLAALGKLIENTELTDE